MAGWLLTLISLGVLAAAPASPRGKATHRGQVDPLLKSLGQQARQAAWTEALDTLDALRREISAKAPLEIVDIQALAVPPQGLGMYTPLVDGTVSGDELYVYAEVRNHGIAEVAGFFEVHLGTDLMILDSQGQELARDEGFGDSHFTARVPHRPTFVSVALRTRGMPAGAYRLRLVLHDRIGRKTAQAEVPFRVVDLGGSPSTRPSGREGKPLDFP